jgi:hypothetical protein
MDARLKIKHLALVAVVLVAEALSTDQLLYLVQHFAIKKHSCVHM